MWESPVNIYETISDMVENEMEGKIIVEIKKQLGIDINKEELIKALQYDRNQYDKGYQDGFNANKWVAVSERLPKDIKPVIVTWKNNNPESYYQHIVGKHFIGVAHYHKGKWYWYSSTTEDFLAEYGRYEGEEFDEAIEVIAWMPLPEPYKAESEE